MGQIRIDNSQFNAKVDDISKTGSRIVNSKEYSFSISTNGKESPCLSQCAEAMHMMDSIINAYGLLNKRTVIAIKKAGQAINDIDKDVATKLRR